MLYYLSLRIKDNFSALYKMVSNSLSLPDESVSALDGEASSATLGKWLATSSDMSGILTLRYSTSTGAQRSRQWGFGFLGSFSALMPGA